MSFKKEKEGRREREENGRIGKKYINDKGAKWICIIEQEWPICTPTSTCPKSLHSQRPCAMGRGCSSGKKGEEGFLASQCAPHGTADVNIKWKQQF